MGGVRAEWRERGVLLSGGGEDIFLFDKKNILKFREDSRGFSLRVCIGECIA